MVFSTVPVSLFYSNETCHLNHLRSVILLVAMLLNLFNHFFIYCEKHLFIEYGIVPSFSFPLFIRLSSNEKSWISKTQRLGLVDYRKQRCTIYHVRLSNLQLFSCSRSSKPYPFQYLYKIKQKKSENPMDSRLLTSINL